MRGGNKFFGIEVEPWGPEEKDKLGTPDGQIRKFRDLLGDHETSYGQKPGEMDGVKLSYNGTPPNLSLFSKW